MNSDRLFCHYYVVGEIVQQSFCVVPCSCNLSRRVWPTTWDGIADLWVSDSEVKYIPLGNFCTERGEMDPFIQISVRRDHSRLIDFEPVRFNNFVFGLKFERHSSTYPNTWRHPLGGIFSGHEPSKAYQSTQYLDCIRNSIWCNDAKHSLHWHERSSRALTIA